MSEEEKIEPEHTRLPAPDYSKISAEGTGLSSEENKTPEENKLSPDKETASQTLNPQPLTSPMEVHHHGHVHEKKKWKEYVFQFFMLFLAVFCGFLAEYQLEHIIEKQREKQYMQSFIYDLQSDTANLNYGFPRKEERLAAIDSVFMYFEKNKNVETISGSVYRYIHRTLWDRHYRKSSTTIDQLKNAGGMRLIRKKNVADSIAAYDLLWQRAEFYREAYVYNQEKGKSFTEKIFNSADLLTKYRGNSGGGSFKPGELDSLDIRINKVFLNEFLNSLSNLKNTIVQDRREYKKIEQSAENLIMLIKKEYQLK